MQIVVLINYCIFAVNISKWKLAIVSLMSKCIKCTGIQGIQGFYWSLIHVGHASVQAFFKISYHFTNMGEFFSWHRMFYISSLHWRHNDHEGVSNHQPHGCLLNRLFRRRSKKTSRLRVTYAENVSIWWRHHDTITPCMGNIPKRNHSFHRSWHYTDAKYSKGLMAL